MASLVSSSHGSPCAFFFALPEARPDVLLDKLLDLLWGHVPIVLLDVTEESCKPPLPLTTSKNCRGVGRRSQAFDELSPIKDST